MSDEDVERRDHAACEAWDDPIGYLGRLGLEVVQVTTPTTSLQPAA